jgi:hypothetical protein
LKGRLKVLEALNMGRCVGGYSNVLSLGIVPSEFFTRHELPALLGTPLVDRHMEKELANVPGGDVFTGGAPRAIDWNVQVWSVVIFFYYGLLFVFD